MTTDIDELLRSIQGLARTIHAETGLYVVYSEHLHRGCQAVTVSVQHDENEFDWFRGSESPLAGYETSIEQARDDLCAYLSEARKAEEAA